MLSYRFLCEQSGMDDFSIGTRFEAGNRWFPQLGKVGPGASLSHGILHAGGVARGRSLQEGGLHRRPELLAAHTRRGWSSRNAGKPTPWGLLLMFGFSPLP